MGTLTTKTTRRPPAAPRPPTRHAVVIGAGFGGLAAAIRLGARGYNVTILEKLDALGGRASVFRQDGFTFDAGPTILTAPFLLEELWRLCGREMADDVTLKPVSPFYRIRFDDGVTFDCTGDPAAMSVEVARLSPGDVAGYERFMRFSETTCRIGFEQLGHALFGSWTDMARVTPQLPRLGGFRSVYSLVSRFIKNERLRVVFSFHPLLIGGNPFTTSAIYTLIPFLERRWGVHFAMGGTGRLVSSLANLVRGQGGTIRCNAPVSRIMVEGALRSAAEMRFRIVQRFHSDACDVALQREVLGVAPCLAAHKKRYLLKLLFRRRIPDQGGFGGCDRCRRHGQMRGTGCVVEFDIIAEHAEKVFFRAHHQRMHPGVEDDVATLESHLWRVARREILHMYRRGNYGAGDAQALGSVPLHLGAKHEFGLQRGHLRFDFQVVVGDQRFEPVLHCGVAHLAGEFARIGAQADNVEPQLFRCDACRGDRMGGIAEDESTLAGEVGRVDRARIPRKPGIGPTQQQCRINADERGDLGDEVACGADADRHGAKHGLAERALQPLRRLVSDFGIEYDVEVSLAQLCQVCGRGTERCNHVDVDAEAIEQTADLDYVVAVAEAEGARAEQVAARAGCEGGNDLVLRDPSPLPPPSRATGVRLLRNDLPCAIP